MTLQSTELECAAVAVAPRVSLADIENAIVYRCDTTADKAIIGGLQKVRGDHPSKARPVADPLKLLSICILVMENGFTVIGKSAPASPENFNAELGRKLAYEDAIRQLWPLMGFSLRDRLSKGVL